MVADIPHMTLRFSTGADHSVALTRFISNLQVSAILILGSILAILKTSNEVFSAESIIDNLNANYVNLGAINLIVGHVIEPPNGHSKSPPP